MSLRLLATSYRPRLQVGFSGASRCLVRSNTAGWRSTSVAAAAAKARSKARSTKHGFGRKEDSKMAGSNAENTPDAQVLEKLADLFESKPQSSWLRIMATSKSWPSIVQPLLQHLESSAARCGDADRELSLLQLKRRLQQANEQMEQYSKVLAAFEATPQAQWSDMLTQHAAVLQSAAFFEYVQYSVNVRAHDGDDDGASDLATVGNALIDAAQQQQQIAAQQEALSLAEMTLDELVKTTKTEQQAGVAIDELSRAGRLDAAMMMTLAKAWTDAKESPYTEEEVKDVLYHLYTKAQEAAAQQQPTEVRVLKYLLTVDDEQQLRELLHDAFTPGATVETAAADYVHVTPQQLHGTIAAVLTAIDGNVAAGKPSMLRDAATMMNADTVKKLRALESMIRKHWL